MRGGRVFVSNEALIVNIGPYCNGVDRWALLVDLSGWSATDPYRRASRTALMQDLANRLAVWRARNKYQLTE